MEIDFDRVREDLRWLRSEDGVVPEAQATAVLARVLKPLLLVEGFTVSEQPGRQESGLDLLAKSSTGKSVNAGIGIEYKHHGQGKPIGLETVEQLLHSSQSVQFDRRSSA